MTQPPFPPFPADPINLPAHGRAAAEVHVLDQPSYRALKAATFANRPLLVRGEPGVGKTQLARAAARLLNRPLVHHVVDSRTESRDLLWTFDAVSRLAEAQLCSALGSAGDPADARKNLAVRNFIRPGVLWWAYDWTSAQSAHQPRQPNTPGEPAELDVGFLGSDRCPWEVPKGWKPGEACVVLIDEIDKAESDVPNGLLEALGSRSFRPLEWQTPIAISGEPPLVIITTNEERALPDAFVRRCLVLHLELPDPKENALRDYLVKIGAAHFGQTGKKAPSQKVLKRAAEMLVEDRLLARDELKAKPLPGQAEYLDLLRAVLAFSPKPAEQEQALDEIRRFVLQKHNGRSP